MSLAAPTSRPELAFPAALVFGSGAHTAECLAPETRPHHAQSTKASGQPADAASTDGTTPRADLASARVLVVDDEALVRRTLSLFLTKAGFSPVAVESGETALDLLRAGEAFDLLVTDQSMPGMTGAELIGEAARLRPDLPVLLVTGYDMAGGLDQLPRDVPILRKPVERAAFISQVQALLDAGEGRAEPDV
jgi:CheY-like chemotaxis protein